MMNTLPNIYGFQRAGLLVAVILAGMLPPCGNSEESLGIFEGRTDIGAVQKKGTAVFLADQHSYRITGSGENMWGSADAFHFLWKKISGDISLTAQITMADREGNAHRKAGGMVRQNLDPGSPYADAVVHADGLISLQYRKLPGGLTQEVQSAVRAPALITLDRDGDVFTLSVARKGDPFQRVGSVSVALSDPVYAGLAVCSHDPKASATAVITDVHLVNSQSQPGEKRILESTLEIISARTGERRVVLQKRDHFEAPNWSRDGKFLLFNSKGKLYQVPLEGGEPRQLDTGMADRCNNDHGFSPDGKWIALSHSPEDRSLVYVMPGSGGSPRLVTKLGPSYWHGWSPDGTTLAYTAMRSGDFDIYTIPVEGGEEKRLTQAPGLDDGPDYSPDGKYIYFNSERTGLMQVWRMRADGSEQEQFIGESEWADWFPHPSPDGQWLVFISYDKTVKGHPANRDVVLRLMPTAGGKPRILATLFGGQGTINVPSWSPDSKYFAFVSYRLVLQPR